MHGCYLCFPLQKFVDSSLVRLELSCPETFVRHCTSLAVAHEVREGYQASILANANLQSCEDLSMALWGCCCVERTYEHIKPGSQRSARIGFWMHMSKGAYTEEDTRRSTSDMHT